MKANPAKQPAKRVCDMEPADLNRILYRMFPGKRAFDSKRSEMSIGGKVIGELEQQQIVDEYNKQLGVANA